ncbi:hypothetical protein NP493_4838g00000 [Ridgeia piscesae]|uniref:Cytochrome P450 n=1 Tax=Ridgeia piscesae TaxID=27915 RepID=A0AAD9IYN6_RIDPI|nr:hypothetical protein NP493_4838g00000 [Ridgeia piscesae]
MTFTEACLCETLRLGTLLPLGVPVKTTCDTSVAGFDIPKDTMVIVNMWAIHRDPDFWSDPHSFNPDRFLDDAGNLVHKPSSYMPFSMGRRVCLGKSVAQSSLMLAIPQLMRQFRFSSPSGKEFKLEFEESGFARIPKSYEFLLQHGREGRETDGSDTTSLECLLMCISMRTIFCLLPTQCYY